MWFQQGITGPSKANISQVVIVHKENWGDLTLCQLPDIKFHMVRDAFPLPQIDDAL